MAARALSRRAWITIAALGALVLLSPVWGFEVLYLSFLATVGSLPPLPAAVPAVSAEDALWVADGSPLGADQVHPVWAGNYLQHFLSPSRPLTGPSTAAEQIARIWYFEQVRPREQDHRWRAFKDAALSVWLTRHATSTQLEHMLGRMAYFGRHAYGLDAAAHAYFGRELKDLTPAQVALLAGLPPRPGSYDPSCAPDRALQRRAFVLQRMEESGLISPDASKAAAAEPLSVLPAPEPCTGPLKPNPGVDQDDDAKPPEPPEGAARPPDSPGGSIQPPELRQDAGASQGPQESSASGAQARGAASPEAPPQVDPSPTPAAPGGAGGQPAPDSGRQLPPLRPAHPRLPGRPRPEPSLF